MLSFENLDAYNRRAERRIRQALGSGTVRDDWPRKETFWRWVVGTVFAGAAMGIFLAWVLS